MVDGSFSCADSFFLVGRVSDYGVEFHMVVRVCFPEGAASGDFGDEGGGFVFDLVDEVFEMAGVDVAGSEAEEGAAGDGFGHGGFADDVDVFCNDLIPDGLVLGRGGGGEVVSAEGGPVEVVGEVEGVEAGFGVDFQQEAAGGEGFPGDGSAVDVAGGFQAFFVIGGEEVVAAEGFAHVEVDDSPRGEDGFFVGVAEGGEEVAEAVDAFFDALLVCRPCDGADAFACGGKDFRVVVFFEGVELLLGDAFGHEFFPGLGVDEGGEVVDGEFFVFVLDVGSVDEKGHADGDAAQDGDGVFSYFLFGVEFFEACAFGFGEFFFLFAGEAVVFFVFFVGESLAVDVDAAGVADGFGGSDDAFEVDEVLEFGLGEREELVVVEAAVVKAVVDGAFDVGVFELLEHPRDVEGFHFAAGDGDDGAEVQKVAEGFLLGMGGFAGLNGEFGDGGEDLKGAVRGEVEDVAFFFDASVDGGGCLYPKDGLHVGGGFGVVASGEHEDACPGFDGDAGGQASAGEGDGAGEVGIVADGFFDQGEGIASFLVLVAFACDVDDLEVLEDGVGFEELAECFGGLDAREYPEGVAEDGAVAVAGEGVVAGCVAAGQEVQEGEDVLLMHEVAVLGDAEELAEVEGDGFIGVVAEFFAQVVGEDVEPGQAGVGVGVAKAGLFPVGFGLLLHDVVPGVDLFGVEVVDEVEGGAGELEDFCAAVFG